MCHNNFDQSRVPYKRVTGIWDVNIFSGLYSKLQGEIIKHIDPQEMRFCGVIQRLHFRQTYFKTVWMAGGVFNEPVDIIIKLQNTKC